MRIIGDRVDLVYDQYTGEEISYTKTTTWYDGSAMNDSKADGVIYRKIIPDGEPAFYVKKNTEDDFVNVLWLGFKNDGVTNNDSLLANATTKYDKLFFPKGTYLFSNLPTITLNNPKIEIKGEGESTVLNATSTLTVIINSAAKISDIKFNNIQLRLHYTNNRGTVITNNFFGGGIIAIYGLPGFAQVPQNISVTNNYFDGHSYGIYGGFNRSFFANNTFRNTTNRNIEFQTGSGNITYNNDIDGGVTGITHLIARSTTSNIGCQSNIIIGNRIRNISEEAISFDSKANNSSDSGSVISGTITSRSTSTTNVQIVPSFDLSGSAFAYLNMYLVPLTGVSKGSVFRINFMGASGTSYIQVVDATISQLAVGTKFIIVVGNQDHLVTDNTIENCTSGIMMWGCAFNNKIVNNKFINSNIKIRSLFGVTQGGYAPCFGNLISRNNLDAKSFISLTHPAYSSADPSEILSIGNRLENNYMDRGTVDYTYQEFVDFENNTFVGTTVNITNSGSSLPTPSINYLGKTVLIAGIPGAEDTYYLCKKLANNTYSWFPVTKPFNIGTGLSVDANNNLQTVVTSGTGNNAITKILNPSGGFYKNSSTGNVGAIKITFPVVSGNNMINLKVSIFDYANNETFKVDLAGMLRSTDTAWGQTTATIYGANNNRNFTVRFNRESATIKTITIGELNSTWDYLGVSVDEIQTSFTGNLTHLELRSGWFIGLETASFGTTDVTINNSMLEIVSNKLTSTTLTGASNSNYPSTLSIKTYTDTEDAVDQKQISTKTANYTVTLTDRTVLVNATSGNLVITLPTAASAYSATLGGYTFIVKKVDSSTNTVTIQGNGAETIDGSNTQVLAAQWMSYQVQSNGTSWFIV